MRGDAGRCGETRGDAGRCGEMRGDTADCSRVGTAAFHVCELAQPSLSGARLQRTVSRAGVPTDGGGHMGRRDSPSCPRVVFLFSDAVSLFLLGRRISPSYPYIEAEVLYACRRET